MSEKRPTMEIPDVPIEVAARDPVLSSLMEQRLRLWLHVCSCPRRLSHHTLEPCNTPDCDLMTELFKHRRTYHAQDQENCPRCKPIKQLMRHWNNCGNYNCPICGPTLVSRVKPMPKFGVWPAKDWHRQHQPLTEDQRQEAIKLMLQFKNYKPNSNDRVRRVVRIEARKYFEADSMSEYYHLLAEKIWDSEKERINRNMEPVIDIHCRYRMLVARADFRGQQI